MASPVIDVYHARYPDEVSQWLPHQLGSWTICAAIYSKCLLGFIWPVTKDMAQVSKLQRRIRYKPLGDGVEIPDFTSLTLFLPMSEILLEQLQAQHMNPTNTTRGALGGRKL